MPHKPVKRSPESRHQNPIKVTGGSESISITFPTFRGVTNLTNISLDGEGFTVNQTSEADKAAFRSIITRIELEGVKKDSEVLKPIPVGPKTLAFKPAEGGKCTIKIFFDHPPQSRQGE